MSGITSDSNQVTPMGFNQADIIISDTKSETIENTNCCPQD